MASFSSVNEFGGARCLDVIGFEASSDLKA